jgi:hypothetical protein
MAESKESKFLSIDAIFAANDIAEEELEVPEWGGKIKLKGISKSVQMNIRKKSVRGNNLDESKMEGLLLVSGIVEPDFQEHHIPDLLSKGSGPVDRVLAAVMRLSGMGETVVEDAAEDLKS